jgi:hypothetical protein
MDTNVTLRSVAIKALGIRVANALFENDGRYVVAGPDTDGDFCVLCFDFYGVSDVVIWGTRERCETEAKRMNEESL